MKKLLLLAAALVLCCASAFAETLELNPEDVALDLSAHHSIEIELADDSAFAQDGADTVTREGTSYIVDNGSLKMALDMGKYPAILCFTQDKYASFEAFLSINPEAVDSLLAQLIEQKINYYLIDLETGMNVYIYARESDNVSTMVANLNTLSEANVQVLTSRVFPGAAAVQAGANRWLQVSDTAMLTIANSQYVIVEFGGSGDAAGDLQDTIDIVSQMTIE